MRMNEHVATKRVWTAPVVKQLAAGDAEANSTGIDDGGPVGNARS